jgi:hypothetical protein
MSLNVAIDYVTLDSRLLLRLGSPPKLETQLNHHSREHTDIRRRNLAQIARVGPPWHPESELYSKNLAALWDLS